EVLVVERAENAQPLAAVLAPQVVKLAADYTHVLAPSSTFGKDLLPRVAALLGAPQISDIMKVVDARTFERPTYAGNVLATVRALQGVNVMGMVRLASFTAVDSSSQAGIRAVALDAALPAHTCFVRLGASKSERPELQSARVVVSGGRGVGSKESFEI